MAEGSDRAGEGVTLCTLNEKGQKQFQKRIKGAADKPDPSVGDYGKAKLPAHKAAFDGNIGALEGIFITQSKSGGITVADKGISPIYMAIKGNKMDSVKWLLRYTTTSILSQTKDGKTPVHLAIEQGNLECIKILMGTDEKGVKSALATVEEKSGLTCLMFCIQKHQNAAFKYLLNELGPKTLTLANSSGVTAAHVAASTGNFDVLKLLANKHKKMLQGKTTDGCTPVYFAAQEGQLEALSYLHESCKVSLSDEPTVSQGYQAIHTAVRGGHVNIVEYLVTNLGRQVLHLTSKDGSTPLHIAASVGDHEMCRWIVSYDSSKSVLKALDAKKGSPAHNAAESEHANVLKFLIESGANPDLANKKGDTPRSIALHSNKPTMIEAVKGKDPPPPPAAATGIGGQTIMTDPLYDSIDNVLDEEKNEERINIISSADTAGDMKTEEGKADEEMGEIEPEQEPIYSVPDPEVIGKKRQVKEEESPPPVPEQNFGDKDEDKEKEKEKEEKEKEEKEKEKEEKEKEKKEKEEKEEKEKEEKQKEEKEIKKLLKKTSSVLQKWPHKDEQTDNDSQKPKLKHTPSKILASAWPPQEKEVKKSEVLSGPVKKKKWPPEPEEEEKEEVVKKEEEVTLKEEVEKKAEDDKEVKKEVEEEPQTQPFIKLRKTVRESKTQIPSQQEENEFQSALQKLKKRDN